MKQIEKLDATMPTGFELRVGGGLDKIWRETRAKVNEVIEVVNEQSQRIETLEARVRGYAGDQ